MDSAIVYFENFAENQASVYKQLEKYLFKPISCPTIVKQSTKDQTRDAAFYSNYYGKALWRDELSPAAMEAINTRVDWEVFSKFNYDPL